MSASREKKFRQEIASQEGYVDPKAQRAAEEQARNRRANALYITVAVVFVAVAAALLVFKSGILQKNTTALTVDDTDYTPGQVSFFYYNNYNNLLNYGTYLNLSSSTDRDSLIGEGALAFLGLEEGTEMTWNEYLADSTGKALAQTHALYTAAVAEGYTADEEIQAHIQENVDAINAYAAQSGYSAGEYLTLVYGKYMDMKTFTSMLEMALIADHYQTDYAESLSYADADLEAYYEANKAHFDMGTYEYLYFSGNAPSTKDEDGNTVEPTEAEKTAAAEKAKTDAAAVLARVNAGEKLEDVAEDYESATYYRAKGTSTSSGSPVDNWVYDEAHQAGDAAVVENENARYVVVFENVSRPEYQMVNVRHIMVRADTSALDKESETYDADVQKIWDEAKAKADDVLNEWKSGDATAESFAALATEKSEDGGSAANGGLYEGVTKSTNFVPSFLDWCFADGRAAGDSGIVESSYGYHVMYLDSFGQVYWKKMADTALRDEATADWLESMTEPVTVTTGDGMKYVG